MTVRIESFVQDTGIYGKVTHERAYKTHRGSPFVVFKGSDGKWQIGQERSGLSVTAMIPRRVQRSKANLLFVVEDMEKALPEACAMIGLLDSKDWPDEIKPYGQQLIEWCGRL